MLRVQVSKPYKSTHFTVAVEIEIFNFQTWNPTRGRAKRGKHKTTCIDTMLKVTQFENENEIRTAMLD